MFRVLKPSSPNPSLPQFPSRRQRKPRKLPRARERAPAAAMPSIRKIMIVRRAMCPIRASRRNSSSPPVRASSRLPLPNRLLRRKSRRTPRLPTISRRRERIPELQRNSRSRKNIPLRRAIISTRSPAATELLSKSSAGPTA